MVSGAYQSSLLRFVVGQYRSGVDRHRKALGRVNSTVRLSAELGTAVVVLPVYIAARASVAAGRRLSAALRGRSLPKLSVRARQLLNFSGFDSLADEVASDVSPDELLVQAVPVLARPMFQMLVAAGHCLSTSQVAELSSASASIERKTLSSLDGMSNETTGSLLVRWVKQCRMAAKRLLNFEEVALTTSGRLVAAKPQQITGVASDIETRSLLLILDYKMAWYGLSPAQQQRLKHKISVVMGSGALARTKQLMPWTDKSKWLAMAKTLIRRLGLRRHNSQKLLPVSSQSSAMKWFQRLSMPALIQPGSGALVVRHSESESPSSSLVLSQTVSISSTTRVALKATAKNRDRSNKGSWETIEADVISTTYIEHPLEKVLKWVDRILLWIEDRWQWLKQTLVSRIEAIFH